VKTLIDKSKSNIFRKMKERISKIFYYYIQLISIIIGLTLIIPKIHFFNSKIIVGIFVLALIVLISFFINKLHYHIKKFSIYSITICFIALLVFISTNVKIKNIIAQDELEQSGRNIMWKFFPNEIPKYYKEMTEEEAKETPNFEPYTPSEENIETKINKMPDNLSEKLKVEWNLEKAEYQQKKTQRDYYDILDDYTSSTRAWLGFDWFEWLIVIILSTFFLQSINFTISEYKKKIK
jgi:hypothetical protein